MRNERTSKRVAAEAGFILKNAETYVRWIGQVHRRQAMSALRKKQIILFLRKCRRVAASALTQAPNKRRK